MNKQKNIIIKFYNYVKKCIFEIRYPLIGKFEFNKNYEWEFISGTNSELKRLKNITGGSSPIFFVRDLRKNIYQQEEGNLYQ